MNNENENESFDSEFLLLVETPFRKNAYRGYHTRSYHFLIKSDKIYPVGTWLVISSKSEKYAIARVVENDNSFKVNYDYQSLSFQRNMTRFNNNEVVCVIPDSDILKLFSENYEQSDFDISVAGYSQKFFEIKNEVLKRMKNKPQSTLQKGNYVITMFLDTIKVFKIEDCFSNEMGIPLLYLN